MTNYRRNFVPGGSYFFTVNLADRRLQLLTQYIEPLRAAFRYTRERHPFTVEAAVILPDHLHAIWTLPEGDANFALRWRLIKTEFSRALPQGEQISSSRHSKGERGIWQRRYWEHTLRNEGDFERHAAALEALGVDVVRVALPRDLDGLAALVMPGGESTTMLRLMGANGLRAPLERFVRERPCLGTCAGVILLCAEADGLPAATLGALDVSVERNAYGRQIDSFSAPIESPVVGGSFPGVFIRAPRIRRVAESVDVIARRAGEPVGVRSGRVVGLCFHPELTSDLRFHRWFLTEVAGIALPDAPEAAAEQTREEAA
jgi:putative transposase